MELIEYLYVDKRRLDSYVEQFSTMTDYDKVPTYKVGLGLTGPSGEKSHAVVSRQRSQHEKVKLLLGYLKGSACLAKVRPGIWDTQTVFCLEDLSAFRVVIPPMADSTDSRTLRVWITTESQGADLTLLEDFREGDEEEVHYLPTALSDLQELSYGLQSLGEEVLSDQINGRPAFESVHKMAKMMERRTAAEVLMRALTAIGGRVGRLRNVSVLYRIRAIGVHTKELFGYPIVMAERGQLGRLGKAS